LAKEITQLKAILNDENLSIKQIELGREELF